MSAVRRARRAPPRPNANRTKSENQHDAPWKERGEAVPQEHEGGDGEWAAGIAQPDGFSVLASIYLSRENTPAAYGRGANSNSVRTMVNFVCKCSQTEGIQLPCSVL